MSAEVASDALWAALAAGLLAAMVVSHRRGAHLVRLSAIVRLAVANPVAYVLVVLGWMWLGWHFFAR